MTGAAEGMRTAAFFDVDGTLARTTIVHYYVYFRRRQMSAWIGPLWRAAGRSPLDEFRTGRDARPTHGRRAPGGGAMSAEAGAASSRASFRGGCLG